ncbi:MAG TPA: hypothetical protein VM140_14245 [Burkholderiales bacterium]|nr:hypothetical protein [Burkholderiales bacterium]
MTALRLALAAFLIACAPALAQIDSPAEIAFWESVRDSRNPAELQAYLDQYPNGRFAALAKVRLAALAKPAAAAQPVAPIPAAPPIVLHRMTSETRMPQVGDTWTYRLSYPKLRGQWGQNVRAPSGQTVKVEAIDGGRIVDLVSIDGGTPVKTTHGSETYLVTQGVSVFSPYLTAYREPPTSGSVGTITILDAPCGAAYRCRASGRVVGQERVTVPAGQFTAVKILIEESWQPASSSTIGIQSAQMNGGRTMTVWYAPELKRALKYSSRITVGDVPPVDSTFDLELVSYQVK